MVAQLHDGSLQDGLGVAEATLIAVAFGGRHDVLVVGIYFITLIIAYHGAAVGIVARLAIGAVEVEGDVTSGDDDTTVYLEAAVDVIAMAVAAIDALVAVDADAIGVGHRLVLFHGVGQSCLEGTAVEGGAVAVGEVVAVGVAEVGTEQDVGHAVGEPFELEVGVDILVPVRAVVLGV